MRGGAAQLFCRKAALIFPCARRAHFFQKRFQALRIPRHGRGTRETHLPGGGRSAPPSLFYKKRRCRLAVPEKNRRGSRSPLPHPKHKKAPPTPPPSSREAPSLSSVGGPGGRPLLPVGHSSSIPPGAFLLDRQAARSLFPRKREWGAESASPWGRKKCGLWPQGKVRAALRQKSCAAAPRNS